MDDGPGKRGRGRQAAEPVCCTHLEGPLLAIVSRLVVSKHKSQGNAADIIRQVDFAWPTFD